MDSIHDDARIYIKNFSQRVQIIFEKFAAAGFFVKYASQVTTHGSELILGFLSANNTLKNIFGFEYEVLVVYSKYQTIEARTFLGIERYMNSSPAKGRVESLLYFLVSEYNDTENWVDSYLLEHKDERIAVPFFAEDIMEKNDTFIVEFIKRRCALNNKFKDKQPIESDSYFFGREMEMKSIYEAFKRKDNIGIFGLRKTGKTSLLLKLSRVLASEKNLFVFLQAQDPACNFLRWNELLKYIAEKITNKKYNFSPKNASRSFKSVLDDYFNSGKDRLVILIDEIEQITPGIASEEHWEHDYTRFFQTIRALQTENRNLNIIVAGLSSYCVDIDRFNKKQNPLFGLITPIYLKGFSEKELINMVNKLSKVSGVSFEKGSIVSLYRSYGGHPLLTRLACSFEVDYIRNKGRKFPEKITTTAVQEHEELRDRELIFYIKHIVSELDEYYHEEYNLLENLAIGNIVDFVRKTKSSTLGRYLYNYGIVQDKDGTPFITIKVVGDFLAFENARTHARPTFFPIIDKTQRQEFTQSRIDNIINDMRLLEKKISRRTGVCLLFGPNSFPHADRLTKIIAPSSWDEFDKNIVPFYLSFVESIDVYGNSINKNSYFWSDIKNSYPILHKALHRIRVYRHNSNHLQLKDIVNEQLEMFLNEDLAGTGEEIPDRYWVLFQRVLDELMRAIQFEDSRLK